MLQEAAAFVYDIKDKKELSKFTAHSIRVGACVNLHSQCETGENIKFRLRWRSDAFMMYLKIIIVLARKYRDLLRNS